MQFVAFFLRFSPFLLILFIYILHEEDDDDDRLFYG